MAPFVWQQALEERDMGAGWERGQGPGDGIVCIGVLRRAVGVEGGHASHASIYMVRLGNLGCTTTGSNQPTGVKDSAL